jgi:hypothetical protein
MQGRSEEFLTELPGPPVARQRITFPDGQTSRSTSRSTGGDGLDEWLPAVGFFDHVMIRARIGGKAYWMDGTRLGDRSLDELEIPPYHWALPIQDSGAALEKLAPGPAAVADTLTIHLDATAGLDAPAPAHLEMTLHGDHASVMHMGLASLSVADRDKLWHNFWGQQYGWIEISRAGAVYDEVAGVERLTMDGAAAMSWGYNADAEAREYETDGGHLGYKADFKREPGPYQDAPYAVDYPAYVRATETILLPQGGVGFGIIGDDVEKTVAAISFKRSSHLDANVFTLEASTRSIAPEFPAADAPAAKIALRELADTVVVLRAPQAYHLTEPEFRIRLTRTPTTILEYLDRGEARLANRDPKAIEDFDRAVQMKPCSTAAASPARARTRSWTRRSRTATPPSTSSRTTPPPSTAAPWSISAWAGWTRPWPTSMRP